MACCGNLEDKQTLASYTLPRIKEDEARDEEEQLIRKLSNNDVKQVLRLDVTKLIKQTVRKVKKARRSQSI